MVMFGTELIVVSGATQLTNVAFKLFTERPAFLRELAKRNKIMSTRGAEKFVIIVRAAYTDSMEGLDEYGHLGIEIKLNQTVKWRKGDIEFKHLLVMDCGNKNDLSDVISHKNIAGKNVHAVRSIAIQIAGCLKFLNETCEVMHGDVKARNFVSRGEGVGYAAIDFDNAASIGEYAGQKTTSSGYLPPEQAAVEYKKKIGQVATERVEASPQYDMWCFGVLLYYLCTGKQLFVMDVREEVELDELSKIVNWSDEDCVEKVDNNVWDNNYWNPMKPLLKKLLKRNPEKRYRRWADIIEKLEDGDIYNEIQVIGQKVQVIENKVDANQKGIQDVKAEVAQVNQYMKAQIPQIMKILRTIDAELKGSCPRTVYIKLISNQAGSSSNLTTCLSNLVKFEVEIYFVCQHSFTHVEETRITTKITRQWVKNIIPVIQCSLFLLRASSIGCIMTGATPINILITSMADLLSEFRDLIINCPETKEFLENPNKGLLQNPSNGKALPPLVGKSYKFISAKANRTKHSEWKKHISPVELKETGDVIWVKKEFACQYS
jgi:serine/threonine protein kinase